MEIKQLVPIILLFLFVGMLLGVGVLTIDKFGRATRTTTTVVSTGQNLSIAKAIDFSEEYCLSIVSVANATSSYSITGINFTDADGCAIAVPAITGCGPADTAYCNITYTYGATTSTATAMINMNSAITPIASTWMSLIVTVVILAIILGIVITSFAGRK